jgi:hypothetical protein
MWCSQKWCKTISIELRYKDRSRKIMINFYNNQRTNRLVETPCSSTILYSSKHLPNSTEFYRLQGISSLWLPSQKHIGLLLAIHIPQLKFKIFNKYKMFPFHIAHSQNLFNDPRFAIEFMIPFGAPMNVGTQSQQHET